MIINDVYIQLNFKLCFNGALLLKPLSFSKYNYA